MATLIEMGEAIARQSAPPRQVLCGFDLYLEALASGKLKPAYFLKGGVPAKGDEPEGALKVPLMAAGRGIVIGLDITLPPDAFRITP